MRSLERSEVCRVQLTSKMDTTQAIDQVLAMISGDIRANPLFQYLAINFATSDARVTALEEEARKARTNELRLQAELDDARQRIAWLENQYTEANEVKNALIDAVAHFYQHTTKSVNIPMTEAISEMENQYDVGLADFFVGDVPTEDELTEIDLTEVDSWLSD